jgi:hypothetical protein
VVGTKLGTVKHCGKQIVWRPRSHRTRSGIAFKVAFYPVDFGPVCFTIKKSDCLLTWTIHLINRKSLAGSCCLRVPASSKPHLPASIHFAGDTYESTSPPQPPLP